MNITPEWISKVNSYASTQTAFIPIPYQGTSMRISNNKQYLIFGTRCGRLVIYDINAKSIVESLLISQSSIWNVFISPDDSYILAGGVDGEIKQVLFPSMLVLPPRLGHTNEINHVIINNANTKAYSCSDDGTVVEWVLNAPVSATLYSHSNIVYALDLSKDNNFIASGSGNGLIILYNCNKSLREWSANVHRGIWCIKISPKNSYIVAGDASGVLYIYTMLGNIVKEIGKHRDRLRCLDWSPDEKFFMSAGNDHIIKIWSFSHPVQELSFDYHSDWIKALVFDQETNSLFSISDDSQICKITVPRFNTNFYMPDELKASRIVYRNETHCLYCFNDRFLYVCSVVTCEIIYRGTLRNSVEEIVSVISKDIPEISINYSDCIINFNIFTLETTIKYLNIDEISYTEPKKYPLTIILGNSSVLVEDETNLTVFNSYDSKAIIKIQLENAAKDIFYGSGLVYIVFDTGLSVRNEHSFEEIVFIKVEKLLYATLCRDMIAFSSKKSLTIGKLENLDYFDTRMEKTKDFIKNIKKAKNIEDYNWVLLPDYTNILHLLVYNGMEYLLEKALDFTPFLCINNKFSPLDIAMHYKKHKCFNVIIKKLSSKMIHTLSNSLVALNYFPNNFSHKVYKFLSDDFNQTHPQDPKEEIIYTENYKKIEIIKLLESIPHPQYFISLYKAENSKIFQTKFINFLIQSELRALAPRCYIEISIVLLSFMLLIAFFISFYSFYLSLTLVLLNCCCTVLGVSRVLSQKRFGVVLYENFVDFLRGIFSIGVVIPNDLTRGCSILALALCLIVRFTSLMTIFYPILSPIRHKDQERVIGEHTARNSNLINIVGLFKSIPSKNLLRTMNSSKLSIKLIIQSQTSFKPPSQAPRYSISDYENFTFRAFPQNSSLSDPENSLKPLKEISNTSLNFKSEICEGLNGLDETLTELENEIQY